MADCIFCKKCGRVITYSSYFKGYYCDECGWFDRKDDSNNIVIKRDGKMWCACRTKFDVLQTDLIGWGNTEIEALGELIKQEQGE